MSARLHTTKNGGRLIRHPSFASSLVDPRHVDVWLPPGYDGDEEGRYPVLYMHDGQNLFDPETAYIGVSWGIDAAMNGLVAKGTAPWAIIVGIWNTENRMREYMPQKLDQSWTRPRVRARFVREYGGPPLSDAYLRFLVTELKPFIDCTYRTLPGQERTFIMGSSMGGLISLYALCEFPAVFGGAACLSTHWPACSEALIGYLRVALPLPGQHRIYFDHGTETLDASYDLYQSQVDEVMRERGYEEGVGWITLKFAGAEHSERAWRERVYLPLQFLLTGRAGVAAGDAVL